MKHHDQKQSGRKGLISVYNPQLLVHHWGKSRQQLKPGNLEAKTEAEAMKECSIPTCLPWLVQPIFFYTQDHLLKGGLAWALPHQSALKKSALQTCLQAVLERHLLRWSSSDQMTVPCVKLTETSTQDSGRRCERVGTASLSCKARTVQTFLPECHQGCSSLAHPPKKSKKLKN